jgi:hypothetical protein
MSTDKPIVPNEWTEFFIALADFGKACGGFHASDPVKAEAMARVFLAAEEMIPWADECDTGKAKRQAQDFAADLVTRARKPLGGAP